MLEPLTLLGLGVPISNSNKQISLARKRSIFLFNYANSFYLSKHELSIKYFHHMDA